MASVGGDKSDRQALHVLSSSESSSEASSESSDEAVGADAETLGEQLREARERVARLQRGRADHDLVLGCELLTARKERRVAQAYANHAMHQRRARAVYEHACQRARERYSRRCERLKQAMDDELARELQRLQNAKAGVSISNRRRRGVRAPASTESALLAPPPVPADASASKLQRQLDEAATVTCYYYDGAAFPISSSTNDDFVESDPDDAVAAMSPADIAQRARQKEKKQLDALLARPRVFAPLVQKLKPADVKEDLYMIKSAMQQKTAGARQTAGLSDQSSTEWSSEDELPGAKRVQQTRRPTHASRRIVVPRGSKKATPVMNANVGAQAETKSPHLILNPQLLVEGQEVVVYKRSPSATVEDGDGELECLLSGVIAATTSTHVFVLGKSGRFESVAVDDWVRGRIVIRAPDLTRRRKQSRHIFQ